MSDFQKRLNSEFSGLYEKVKELDEFTKSDKINDVPKKHRHLLYIQLASMRTYLQCLESRVQLLNSDELKNKK
jgi:hypothetical protein